MSKMGIWSLRQFLQVSGLDPSHGLRALWTDLSVISLRSFAVRHILQTDFVNPKHDSRATWASNVCQNRIPTDLANLTSSHPTQEWTAVLSRDDELKGNVGLSGTVVMEKLSSVDPNDFGADVPFTHPFYNDWEFFIALDDIYTSLLAPANTGINPKTGGVDPVYHEANRKATDPIDKGGLGLSVPHGVLGVETDRGLVPDEYRAQPKDRVAVFGRWIVDCGHDDYHTEIHPPLLLAVARPGSSGERTSVKVLGRPFLVSQIFDGDSLVNHLVNKEVPRIAGETYVAELAPWPFDLVALKLIDPFNARANIISPGFSLEQFYFYVRPPTPRQSPDDKLLISFHFTVRSGVQTVVMQTANPDEVEVGVIMSDIGKSTNPPPAHDIRVMLTDFTWQDAGAIIGLLAAHSLYSPLVWC
jgi:hypothetical protein